MNLIERYALSTGVKIGKPFIYEKFFPLPFHKYITFQPISKAVKNYDYWQDVLDDIIPALEEAGIRILQLGGKDEHKFNGPVHLQGLTSLNQAAYLLNRSMLHIGVDSFQAHIAGSFNVPIVALYSNSYVQNSKPYWGDASKQILLSPDFSKKKPSFSSQENPKTVNSIKSETISKAALKLLGLKDTINYETVFVGKQYSNTMMFSNVCPSNSPKIKAINGLEVRMDLDFNEQFLEAIAQRCQVAVVTDKAISLDLLRKYKANIGMLFFMVKDNTGLDFIKKTISLGIKINLISSLKQEDIDKLKIEFYETGMIGKLPEIDEKTRGEIESMPSNSLKFKSNKTYLKEDGVFYNKNKMDKNLGARLPEYQPVGEANGSFFDDFQFYKIIKES